MNTAKKTLLVVGCLIGLAATGCSAAASRSSAPAASPIAKTAPASASAPATVTKTASPPPVKVVIVQPTAAQTVYEPAPAAAAPALTNCNGGTGTMNTIYAGADTSCAFAINVANSWPGFNGTVSVYSPVTGDSYSMTYTQEAGDVIATGGNGAFVQF
jgi:hypothetical protein